MTPYIIVWAALAVVILALAIWRQFIDLHEDDTIHLADSETGMVSEQAAMARKIGSIDKVGKLLTVVAAVYGLVLCGWAVYHQWIESTKL